MAPPPPVLMDELVEEALFRLPPDDARSLLRAALVCKRWRRLVSSPGFRRRFSEFHGTPPMQGVLCATVCNKYGFKKIRFVPASSSSFRPPRSCEIRDRRLYDARHGRVLLRGPSLNPLFVWVPITDDVQPLPNLPAAAPTRFLKAAVLCAGSLGGACGHLDCLRGPYLVVYVGSNDKKQLVAYVYSSESGAWSQPTYSPDGLCPSPTYTSPLPSVVLENALYFEATYRIVKYDLLSREFSAFDRPLLSTDARRASAVLTTMEDGRLGYAIAEDSSLFLWSRDAAVEAVEENFGWAVTRVIDLATLLSAHAISGKLYMAGFAHDVGILLSTEDGLFAFDPKSTSVRMVCKHNGGGYGNVYPYMSFYTPVLGMASTSDGGRASASCT